MTPPKVAVVILNFNGRGHLERFLPSVYASQYPNWDLYVADNNSSDDSIAFLEKEGFQLLQQNTPTTGAFAKWLLRLPQNYGFAEGYNAALKQVQADYYVLLNSDVEVAADWINPIISLMESDKQVAACQPKINMYADKTLFEHAGGAGGWVDKWGYPFCRGRIFETLEKDEGQYDDVQEVFWASGAALFIRSNLYHALGGLDGDFFAHMEEIDLCWRLKRANYKIMVCPQAQVWHVGGGTLPMNNPKKDYLNFRNSLATVFKNAGTGWRWWIIWLRLLLDGVAGLRFLLQGKWRNTAAIIKAHWAFFGWMPALQRKRTDANRRIAQYAYETPKFNAHGVLRRSIVWAYFAKKQKKFSDLG